jgi:cytochrome c oxidase cbb3-type subunit 3
VLFAATQAWAFEAPPLTPEEATAAAGDYQKYCALCHGPDRAGHANDDAPSLRSETLMRTGFPEFLLFTVAYGRRGTAMGAYFEEVGGPMNNDELYRLVRWLKEQVAVESIDLPPDPISGDTEKGRAIYASKCANCHGDAGEGYIGPAIGNPAFLALASDAFLRYTIEHGRDGTEMQGFAELLSPADLDAVTAFLRSRETHWEHMQPVLQAPPTADQYVLNPAASAPDFQLQDGMYVMAKDLNEALQGKRRIVVLDTRVTSMWQIAHIEGAVPIPYYHDGIAGLAEDLPTDGTWIVSYCECPRAAAESVTQKLRAAGFKNTAVLYEGIQGWISLGYPVFVGQLAKAAD